MNTFKNVILKNLTPNDVNFILPDGKILIIPASGVVARVDSHVEQIGHIGAIPVINTVFELDSDVIDLPDPQDGVIFIINFKPGNPIPLGAGRKGSFFYKKIKKISYFFLLSPEKSSILNMTEQKSKKSAERRRANGSKRAKCNDINKGKVVS